MELAYSDTKKCTRANVMYTFNDNYAPFMGVSMMSLFMSNKDIDEINVYVVAEHLSEKNRVKLEKVAKEYNRNLIFVEGEKIVEKVKRLGFQLYRGVGVTFFKLFIDDFVEPDVDRLLYIDCDTLVTGSIAPLFMCDMHDNVIGVTPDSIILWDYKNQPYVERNIGVMLYDVEKWRKEKWGDKIIHALQTGKNSYPVCEQSAVSDVCNGCILDLHIKYNFQVPHRVYSDKTFYRIAPKSFYPIEEVVEARNDPAILHIHRFLGELPWSLNTLHPDRDIFDKYLNESPWNDYEKTPGNGDLVFKIERALYKFLPETLFLVLFNTFQKMRYIRNYKQKRINQ